MSIVARFVAMFLGAGLILVHPGDAEARDNTSVIAEPGGMAAGRDITGNTINFGLTPEQVRELTEAAARGATGPLTTTIVDLSKRLGVTEDATKTLLRIVGEQDVPVERLSETLNRVADNYKRLQAQAAALNPDNPTARGLVERAQTAITAGNLEEAHQLFAQARQAQIAAAQEALKLRDQAQATADAELLGAAESTATEGKVAVTELDFVRAAHLFRQAAELVPAGHEEVAARYKVYEKCFTVTPMMALLKATLLKQDPLKRVLFMLKEALSCTAENGLLQEDEFVLLERQRRAGEGADPQPVARTYLVFFDGRDSALTTRARQIIREASNASTKVSYTRIEVNGHTDTFGMPRYNIELSLQRAQAAEIELIKDGVPPKAITIQSFGDTHLLVPTGRNVREPQNNRVEIILR